MAVGAETFLGEAKALKRARNSVGGPPAYGGCSEPAQPLCEDPMACTATIEANNHVTEKDRPAVTANVPAERAAGRKHGRLTLSDLAHEKL